MASYTQWLRARSDDHLTQLLTARPDLASPSPVTITSLAVRATSRSSLLRAVADLDTPSLRLLETLAAFGPTPPGTVTTMVAGPTSDEHGARIEMLTSLGLVVPDEDRLTLAPGLGELFGPYPAGLAPDTSAPCPDLALLDEAPPAATAVLDALTWGPPVGRTPPPATKAATAVTWLLSRHFLTSSDADQVVLPRAVALALRDGRLFTDDAEARRPTPTPVDPLMVVAEQTRAATAFDRLVGRLVDLWAEPPAALRSGGLGVRELRRLAAGLGTDEPAAALVLETAWSAGLVTHEVTGPAPGFVLTTDADLWAASDLAHRWERLARAWVGSRRATWLVGTKDDQGATRTALHPDGLRAWLPRLRARVLRALADVDGGLSAHQLVDLLAWSSPRSVPPLDVVESILAEAQTVGLVGAGALTPAGRAAIAPDGDLAGALTDGLPEPVDTVYLQADLTGVVPGRPSERLARLLGTMADVESHGAGLTVRFTPESVRSAITSGTRAQVLLDELEQVAAGGVPQPLEYLIRDAARSQDRVRVGVAQSYLRSDDEALLRRLVVEHADLGLNQIAPTVLVASVSAAALVGALAAAGVAARAEGPDGRVVDLASAPRRARPRNVETMHEPVDVAAVVARLREGPVEEPQQTDVVVALREAAGRKAEVVVGLVAGAGTTERRLLRPVSIDGGRLRAVDPARETEVVVALHRVASVEPASLR